MTAAELIHHGYGIRRDTELDYAAAVDRVRTTLTDQGFGILTEIDVAATMAAKLGVSMPPYIILGACNPTLAHRAIEAEPEVGLLLPCNVVVRSDGAATVVEAMDPEAALSSVKNAVVRATAAEARQRLIHALEAI